MPSVRKLLVPSLILLLTIVTIFYTIHPFEHSEDFINGIIARTGNITTCSVDGDRRGFHQKIIAFSLYGQFSDPVHYARYVKPLTHAVERAKVMYPGWTVRIYLNINDNQSSEVSKIKRLFQSYANVDFCNATRILEEKQLNVDTFEMNWRFLPLLDPMVDYFMSRDGDSSILQREVDAVNQWLSENSRAAFHVMRDHPQHDARILGGLWGAKVNEKRAEITVATTRLFTKETPKRRGVDQELLYRYIWPLAQNDMVAHDSYMCSTFPSTRPFPTQRYEDLFVGTVCIGNDCQRLKTVCPETCRPPEHQDWIYC